MSPSLEERAVAETPKKDIWDKIAALTPAIVTLMLGLLGWHATDPYNSTSLAQQKGQSEANLNLQREQASAALAQQKAQAAATNLLAQTQTLDHLYSYISSSDPRKRLFGYTMYAHLGNEELAAKLVSLNHDEAGKPLLIALGKSPQVAVRKAAADSLQTFFAMGPLEQNTNRQGLDFDAFGKTAANAELCAEMCRVNAQCKAMTYVISAKTCWLKIGTPPASSNADMISAVKVGIRG